MKRLLVTLLVFMLIQAAGCRDGLSGPQPGILTLHLTMPSANAGQDVAMLFTVRGPAQITSAQPASGLQLYHAGFGGDSTRFIVTGSPAGNGTVLTLSVPDMRRAGDYTARVDEVAYSATYALRSQLAGYELDIRGFPAWLNRE